MIKLSLTIFFLFGVVFCYSQKSNELNKDTSDFKKAPLYILQLPLSNPIEATGIFININDIDSVAVLNDSTTKVNYGVKANNGIIIFKTKKYIKVLTISEILSSYNIQNKNLRVFVDSVIIYKPETYYADPKLIKSANIQEELNSGTKYISVLSIYPIRRPKPGEIYIRGKVYDVKVNQ